MVFLIIWHDIRRLVEDVMGRWRLTRPVQSRKFCRADLLGAGGPGQPAAVLGPAVFTRAAGGGQEALSHAEALRRKGSGLLLPIHYTCREENTCSQHTRSEAKPSSTLSNEPCIHSQTIHPPHVTLLTQVTLQEYILQSSGAWSKHWASLTGPHALGGHTRRKSGVSREIQAPVIPASDWLQVWGQPEQHNTLQAILGYRMRSGPKQNDNESLLKRTQSLRVVVVPSIPALRRMRS